MLAKGGAAAQLVLGGTVTRQLLFLAKNTDATFAEIGGCHVTPKMTSAVLALLKLAPRAGLYFSGMIHKIKLSAGADNNGIARGIC